MTHVVLVPDGSPQVGTGHVYRCATLADALRDAGAHCTMVVHPTVVDLVPGLARSAHEVVAAEDVEAALSRGDQAAWLVVDSYRASAPEERSLAGHASRLLVIDDLADRPHVCDVLLDQSFGREASDYRGLVPEATKLLIGPEHALVRPAFAAHRLASLSRRDAAPAKQRLLVFMSGSDPEGTTCRVLADLAPLAGVAVDVVVGAGAVHGEEVERQVAGSPRTTLHRGIDGERMARLLSRADVAIGAGGTSSWERCTLGVPTLIATIADNQRLVAKRLCEAGAAVPFEPGDGSLQGALAKLDVARASEAARAICDGRGAQRVAHALLYSPQ